jgi:hypothetical protein
VQLTKPHFKIFEVACYALLLDAMMKARSKQMEQGTVEWFAARCGKVTASRVADIIAKTKTGFKHQQG